jgi:tetratricopeptide (TPR) repeat protein
MRHYPASWIKAAGTRRLSLGARRVYGGCVDPQGADPPGVRITHDVVKKPGADAAAAFNRGFAFHRQGETADARDAYQQAIDSGHPRIGGKAARNLGLLLLDAGDTQGARTAFEKAVALGDPQVAPRAAYQLGKLLLTQGDPDGARAAFELVAERGEGANVAAAALYVGQNMMDHGDPAAAEAFLRIALDGEDPVASCAAAVNLGAIFVRRGEKERAIPAFRRAIDCKDRTIAAAAAGELGVLLAAQRPDEAELLLRRAVEAGYAPAMTGLADMLYRRARAAHRAVSRPPVIGASPVAAYAHATTPAERATAVIALAVAVSDAVRLPPSEELETAERLYRRAISAGEYPPLNHLAVLMHECGRLDEAEEYYRRAIAAGVTVAWTNLARLLLRRDPAAITRDGADIAEARDLLERGAQAGDAQALTLLGALAVTQRGAFDEAGRLFGQAAEAGSATARIMLLIALTGDADPARTRALIEQIAADDDEDALDAVEAVADALVGPPDLLDAIRHARTTHDPAAWQPVADYFAAMG